MTVDIQKLKALAEADIHAYDELCANGGSDRHKAWTAAAYEFAEAANPGAVLELIAEIERLQHFEVAYKEFSDKTDWVQETSHWSELGMHRADVLRKRCHDAASQMQAQADQLKKLMAENEALRNGLAECTESLHAEMLCKFGGQRPEDMHPVTRREYDRDMAEISCYREALNKEPRP